MLSNVPTFSLYGEPVHPLAVGFLHAETVMSRKHLHFGKVEHHRHDRMAQITFWTKGCGSYLIEDAILEFSAPAVSFIPSGVVHGFNVVADETDAIVISIADSALSTITELTVLPLAAPLIVMANGNEGLWDRLSSIAHLILTEYAHGLWGTERVILPMIAAVLAQIARLASTMPIPALSAERRLAIQLRQLVDLHFRENWAVANYVEALRTTPYLLAKACEMSFGQQVKELLVERRLLEAKRLLLFTIRPIEDISYELGMKEAAYFSRFFRQRTGEPPGEWRRKQTAHLGEAPSNPVSPVR